MPATRSHKPTNALKTSPIETAAPDHNAADRIDAAVLDASKLPHRTLYGLDAICITTTTKCHLLHGAHNGLLGLRQRKHVRKLLHERLAAEQEAN